MNDYKNCEKDQYRNFYTYITNQLYYKHIYLTN